MKTLEQISNRIVGIKWVVPWFGLLVPGALVSMPQGVRAAPTTAVNTPGDNTRWICPRPPYAEQARRMRQQGVIYVRITTDSTGVVTKAVASVPTQQKQGVSILGVASVRWVLARWHGPPNVQRKVMMEYRLTR